MSQESNTPLISIITVCYNAEQALLRTARSVASQQGDRLEYIVQDGGSNDGCAESLASLALDAGFSERIAVSTISEPDGGIYDAMNRAAIRTNGEWILFLNADDTFASDDILARISPILQTSAADVVYGDVIYRYADRQQYIAADSPLSEITRRMIFCHQSVFVRRSVLLSHPFDLRYKICSDFDFFRKLYIEKFLFQRIPSTAISIYEAVDGISSTHDTLFAKEVYQIRTEGRLDLGFWYIKHMAVKLLKQFGFLR